MNAPTKLTSHALADGQMQIILTFDKNMFLENRVNAENALKAFIIDELGISIDNALHYNFDLISMPMVSEAIN